jgi:phenylalanyl-tRNA synthetase beta chain
MRFNFHAIQRYVTWQDSPEALCDLLTQLGLEVEGVQAPDPICQGLLVGEVLAKDPHPDADKLSLCTVQVGMGELRQIVCGATNHFAGAKVVVALPGQELPGGMKIEKRKVRGVASEGMMCSAREIGLGEEHEGILLLPEDAVVGSPAAPYLTTIEINVTPNRPDCLGWIGIAREIAAATGQPLRLPKVPPIQLSSDIYDHVEINIEDPEGCPRYLGRVLRGVNVGPSPKWLQDSVTQVGLSSINNVVDVTNFVLMECGHPLHAFDLSKLSGPLICVHRADESTKLAAINHEIYELGPEHLVISDQNKAVALAGIMGGEGSEVTESTKDLFLECAYFNPSRIRKGSRLLGLGSDSSFRFERGTDAYGLQFPMDRCASLILEVAGGMATSPLLEAVSDENLPKRIEINLRTGKTSETIGAHLSESAQAEILRNLGCQVTELDNGQFHVEAPGFRPDLATEIDLIEEIARHHGYSNIPSTPPELPTKAGELHPVIAIEKAVRDQLAGRGWHESKSFSFARPDFAERLNLGEANPLRHSVAIENPLSAETTHMRTTMLASLLDTLEWNAKRGERSLRIFEFGKVYLKDFGNLLNCERLALGLAWLGSTHSHWSGGSRAFDFFDAKGTCEALLNELGVPDARLELFECEYFYPGQSGKWMSVERSLGVVGRIHPIVARRFDLPSDPILVEMDMDAVLASIQPSRPAVHAPSPFPAIRRDLSLTVPVATSARDLESLIAASQTPYLERFELFDRYAGDQLGAGRQSLAYRLTYRSDARTLSDEEITPIHQGLLKQLNERLGAVQRGMESERPNREQT